MQSFNLTQNQIDALRHAHIDLQATIDLLTQATLDSIDTLGFVEIARAAKDSASELAAAFPFVSEAAEVERTHAEPQHVLRLTSQELEILDEILDMEATYALSNPGGELTDAEMSVRQRIVEAMHAKTVALSEELTN